MILGMVIGGLAVVAAGCVAFVWYFAGIKRD